ncbi:MAG TPA: hypothetical protein VM889_05215 [Candidatus Thermoplasmatota archaeon]|nr:hypothetical protein [Candidatus Thermoplasmatota archaeon]
MPGHGLHTDRVSEAFARDRIRATIESIDDPRPREGLAAVERDLESMRIPPAIRLHLVSAVAHLGRQANETLPARLKEANGY